MSSTPPIVPNSDAWVDLLGQASPIYANSPRRVTPVPFGGEQDYLRMLREAQRETCRSSSRVSPITSAIMSLSSTCRNTPSLSPKSPPNSPNPELSDICDELRDVYINTINSNVESDILWDWSSRPNLPFKEWRYSPCTGTPTSKIVRSRKSSGSVVKFQDQCYNLAEEAVPDDSSSKPMFSKGVVYTIIITNVLSIIVGAGIGIWLCKRTSHSSLKLVVPMSL